MTDPATTTDLDLVELLEDCPAAVDDYPETTADLRLDLVETPSGELKLSVSVFVDGYQNTTLLVNPDDWPNVQTDD